MIIGICFVEWCFARSAKALWVQEKDVPDLMQRRQAGYFTIVMGTNTQPIRSAAVIMYGRKH